LLISVAPVQPAADLTKKCRWRIDEEIMHEPNWRTQILVHPLVRRCLLVADRR